MKSNLQTALFGDAFQSAKTNKKQFLEKMDSLIPWQDWVSIISTIYYEGKVGQKPYPIELMLRIHILLNNDNVEETSLIDLSLLHCVKVLFFLISYQNIMQTLQE